MQMSDKERHHLLTSLRSLLEWDLRDGEAPILESDINFVIKWTKNLQICPNHITASPFGEIVMEWGHVLLFIRGGHIEYMSATGEGTVTKNEALNMANTVV